MPVINSTENTLDVNAQGRDGLPGRNGVDGHRGHTDGDGGNGSNGDDGIEGKAADDIFATLATNSTDKVHVVISEDNTYQIPLGNPEAEIILNAQGGYGGAGGRGGNGGQGGDGSSGRKATQYSHGENGHDGGRGGNGGNGGRGGDGGNGGDVTINLAEKDLDLLMLVKPNVNGGDGGSGGKAGTGGKGGEGGAGGGSYEWNETYYTHDDQGHMQPNIRTNIEQGGHSGSQGSSGSDGSVGSDGHSGHHGNYKIHVAGLGTYPDRYHVALHSFLPITGLSNVIEPEETLSMNQLTITNNSTMPTPAKINIAIIPNEWIAFDPSNQLVLSQSLQPGEHLQFSDPLIFNVQANKFAPTIDSTFHARANIWVNAALPRVNKSFSHFLPQPISLDIAYPVEISAVSNAQTISIEEEAPFAIQIRNISDRPIGIISPSARAVQLNLSATQKPFGVDLTLYDQSAGHSVVLSNYSSQLMTLAPHTIATFGGTLQFTNRDTPAYTQVKLSFDLQFANIKDNHLQTIQTRNFDLQLANNYEYFPDADFILVTNQQINEATVKAWENVAASFGSRLSVWNTSLNSGLSYTKRRNDNESFRSQLHDNVIIILNNDFLTDKNERTNSTAYLDKMEIFDAAKDKNIATYVVGPEFNVQAAATPLRTDTTKLVNGSLIFWKKPTEEKLIKKVDKLNQEFRKTEPTAVKLAVVDFEPVKMKSCFVNKWQLGKVQFRDALSRDQSHIGHRAGDVNHVDAHDVYNVIKLLPFFKKLKYLVNCQDDNNRRILTRAILSDLADELTAFAHSKWRSESTKMLAIHLHLLNQLKDENLETLCHNAEGRDCLSDLLLKYENLLKRLPDKSDKYFFPMFKQRKQLSSIGLKKVAEMINRYFPGRDFSSERIAIANQGHDVNQLDVGEFDNRQQDNEVVKRKDLPQYKPSPSSFSEGSHFFKYKNKEVREKSIAEQAASCKFDNVDTQKNQVRKCR